MAEPYKPPAANQFALHHEERALLSEKQRPLYSPPISQDSLEFEAPHKLNNTRIEGCVETPKGRAVDVEPALALLKNSFAGNFEFRL